MTTLREALKAFEATDANLRKLEALWTQIRGLIPDHAVFGAPPEYDEACFAYRRILASVPAIDGFRVEDDLLEFDEIAQMRVDEFETGMIEIVTGNQDAIGRPGKTLHQYRLRLASMRRRLIRDRVFELSNQIGRILDGLKGNDVPRGSRGQPVGETIPTIKECIGEIDTLLGGQERPERWNDMRRHIFFATPSDIRDLITKDWPAIRSGLSGTLYGAHDPLPVEAVDLADMVRAKPSGPVPMALKWEVLSAESFERLIYLLCADVDGYENPQWLQQTNAPDRGRDLSVTRIVHDPLGGTRRYRTIIQCKHWLKHSVGSADIGASRDQMELWQPPRVDTLIFACTGRFTADAIALVEQHNQADRALRIEMWPESHLEWLLAARPHLVAEFGLRV